MSASMDVQGHYGAFIHLDPPTPKKKKNQNQSLSQLERGKLTSFISNEISIEIEDIL